MGIALRKRYVGQSHVESSHPHHPRLEEGSVPRCRAHAHHRRWTCSGAECSTDRGESSRLQPLHDRTAKLRYRRISRAQLHAVSRYTLFGWPTHSGPSTSLSRDGARASLEKAQCNQLLLRRRGPSAVGGGACRAWVKNLAELQSATVQYRSCPFFGKASDA